MVIKQGLLGFDILEIKGHLMSLPEPDKLGSNEQNLSLWLVEQGHSEYAETTLVVQLMKGGFGLRGQRS